MEICYELVPPGDCTDFIDDFQFDFYLRERALAVDLKQQRELWALLVKVLKTKDRKAAAVRT